MALDIGTNGRRSASCLECRRHPQNSFLIGVLECNGVITSRIPDDFLDAMPPKCAGSLVGQRGGVPLLQSWSACGPHLEGTPEIDDAFLQYALELGELTVRHGYTELFPTTFQPGARHSML